MQLQLNINKTTLVTFVVGIIVGITANFLTSFISTLFTAIGNAITPNRLPWIIVGILIAVLLYVLLVLRRQDARRHAHQLSLAASLLLLFPAVISEADLETGLHNLVYLLLTKTSDAFDVIPRRGILLLPDENREYLILFEQSGIVNDKYKDQIKFYIGGDDNLKKEKGGVAGRVWESKQPCTCYFQNKKDIEQSVKNGYIVFDHELQINGSVQYPYRSLICVPIIREENKDRLGVICFDSKHRNHFDSKHVMNDLNMLARYIDITLLINDQLQKLRAAQSSSHKPDRVRRH